MDNIELLQAIQHYDLLMHPYVLYCNPKMAEEIKDIVPDTIILKPTSYCEYGKAYLVDRNKCEIQLKDFVR